MTKLQKAVMEIVESHKEENENFVEEVLTYGCQSGIVSELIYYSQTHEWFDKYYNDILELIEEYEDSTGVRLRYEGDMKNWFSWFSFEEMVQRLYA